MFALLPSPLRSRYPVFVTGASSQCLHSRICFCTLNITYLSSLYSRVCFRTIIYSTYLYCLYLDHPLSSYNNMCSYPNHLILTQSALCFTRIVQLRPLFSVFQSVPYSLLCVCINIINYSPTLFCFRVMF